MKELFLLNKRLISLVKIKFQSFDWVFLQLATTCLKITKEKL